MIKHRRKRVPGGRTRSILVRVSEEEYDEIEQYSINSGESMSDIMRNGAKMYIISKYQMRNLYIQNDD